MDLRDALRNVQALLRQEAQNLQVHIQLSIPSEALTVKADAIEMEQVLFNLLRNAMEALQQVNGERTITITAAIQGQYVQVEVADNGPGIAPHLRSELFTPFVTSKEGGTGLGLALSQRLIERAGGELLLQDTQGAGAVFRILLAYYPTTTEQAE
jgi:C4-dicarboxylate-specific signal transduction histidine kinase